MKGAYQPDEWDLICGGTQDEADAAYLADLRICFFCLESLDRPNPKCGPMGQHDNGDSSTEAGT